MGHLVELHFFSIAEAQDDAERACREQSAALAQYVYGESEAARCAPTVAAQAGHFVQESMRSEMRALDRIAARLETTENKALIVGRAKAHLATMATRGAELLAQACGTEPREPFVDTDRFDFFRRRADCLTQSIYLQTAIRCVPE
jgi:hypothetical protein